MSLAPAISLDRAAVFLDFDGVFAELRSHPEAVQPTAERIALLRTLRRDLDGRLAVLSGRTLVDLDRVLGGEVEAVAALNGLQRRAPGRSLADPPPHRALAEVTDVLQGLARTWPGVKAEAKGLSVALHYRQAPQAGAELRRILQAIGRSSGLAFHDGSMVAELATPGWDKGRAILDLMSAAPFAGMAPIFAGDDASDEPGFAAVREAGGFGVLVGERRRTLAQGRLASPEALRAWLRRCLSRGAFEPPAGRSGAKRTAASEGPSAPGPAP